MSTAKASGSSAANGSASQRNTNAQPQAERKYTVEQKAAVLRVRRCTPTAFYDVLGLEETRTTCSDSDIKKAYRKLSLLTHPDKNGFEGADEAFKMVSRAFQILSDADKRSKYDRFGGDPDNRFSASGAAAGASPFSSAFASSFGGRSPSGGGSPFGGGGGRGPGGGGQAWEEEITPEELFQRFFSGQMGGGMGPFGGGGGLFDTGPGFVFNLGGGPGAGFRMHQFGGPGVRRRPHNHSGGRGENEPPPSLTQTIWTLLPLLLVVVLPVISNFLGGLLNPPTVLPSMHFDGPPGRGSSLTMHRTTPRLKVDYYVDPGAVEDWSMKRLRNLDASAEVEFVNRLKAECEVEVEKRDRLVRDAQGWFGIDQELIERARQMDLRSCRRIESLGVNRW